VSPIETAIADAVRAVVREEVEPLRRELRAALAGVRGEQLLSAPEAALELGVSRRTVSRWFATSPDVVARGRIRRISRANLRHLAGGST
jgi:hypothetical protein